MNEYGDNHEVAKSMISYWFVAKNHTSDYLGHGVDVYWENYNNFIDCKR